MLALKVLFQHLFHFLTAEWLAGTEIVRALPRGSQVPDPFLWRTLADAVWSVGPLTGGTLRNSFDSDKVQGALTTSLR